MKRSARRGQRDGTRRTGGLLLGCLFLLSATLHAQQYRSIRGTVRDTAGAPLEGAELLFGNRSVRTNAQGAYRIDSLRTGNVFLTVRFAGYVPIRATIRIEETRPSDLSFVMTRAPFLLPPIVTEVRRTGIYGAVGDTFQRPLRGVRVQVAGVNGGVKFTDSLGAFAFSAADRGAYLVRMTYPGFGERRFPVELNPGEGRQIVAVLSPSTVSASREDDQVFEDLRRRLAFGLRRNFLTPDDLSRYGSQGLCEIPRIFAMVGRFGATTTVLLNGTTPLYEFPVSALCAWRADDISLVEFGGDVCADVTSTIGQALSVPAWCSGRSRNVPRSMGGGATRRIRGAESRGSSYIIIWEKR
jgi:carboxypeptidase family protein